MSRLHKNKEYWEYLFVWLKKHSLENNFISEKDLKLISIVDTPKQVLDLLE